MELAQQQFGLGQSESHHLQHGWPVPAVAIVSVTPCREEAVSGGDAQICSGSKCFMYHFVGLPTHHRCLARMQGKKKL